VKQLLMLFAAVTLPLALTLAQNWPQWRGPSDNLLAEPGSYPLLFDATEDLSWKITLPGKGSSTPVVWNNRIVITCGIGEGDQGVDGVLCYDLEGRELWRVTLGPQRKGRHRRGSGSCPSPVTDGERIVVYYKSGNIAALNFAGKVLWHKNLQRLYGEDKLWWDLGTSPVLVEDKVVVAVMHEENSYVVALDAANGAECWKVDRNFSCAEESHQSYTTPHLYSGNGRKTLVLFGADHLTGHAVDSGHQIWKCGGFNPENKKNWRVIASPVICGDIAVVPYGREKFMAGIRLGGQGDITDSARLWSVDGVGCDATTPVAVGGNVYYVNYKGTLGCIAAESGQEHWRTRLPEGKGMFYSSPVLAGDKLYISREKGTLYIYQVSRKGAQLLHETQFKDEFFVATPVLLLNRLILRGEKRLYCVHSAAQ
jgi:outer membrane protein assembly factor BamB